MYSNEKEPSFFVISLYRFNCSFVAPRPFPPCIRGLCLISFKVLETFLLTDSNLIGFFSTISLEDILDWHSLEQNFLLYDGLLNSLWQALHLTVNFFM